MSRYYGDTKYMGYSGFSNKPRRNPWVKILKICCWVVGILIVICGCFFFWLATYINSDRIISLIESKSSEYLRAEVKIGSLDYKSFRSWPWLDLKIDSLTVISKSLDDISPEEKAKLPDNANFLASVEEFEGRINIPALFHNKIEIQNIEIERPKINLVIVNDSVSNFNIARSLPHVSKIPEIDISEINIEAPMDFSFFSLQNEIRAMMDVEKFYLAKTESKSYQIGFTGDIDGQYGDISLPGKIPVDFISDIKVNFPDININLKSLNLTLFDINIGAKGDLTANNKGLDLQEAEFNLRIEDLFSLLDTLPKEVADLITLPKGLSGSLPLEIDVNLLSSYHINPEAFKDFTLESMPNLSAILKVEDAKIALTPPGMKRIYANDIYLEAICNFDPQDKEDTNLLIKELRLHGEGINLSGEAQINNLIGEEQNFEGNLNFGSPLMKTLSYLLPNQGFSLDGYLKGNFSVKGKAGNLGKDGLKNLLFTGKVNSHSLSVNSKDQGTVSLRNMKGDFEMEIPSYPISNYKDTELDFEFTADTVQAAMQDMKILLTDVDMNLDARDTVSGNPDPFGVITAHFNTFKFSEGTTSFSAENINMKTSGSLKTGGPANYTAISLNSSKDDELIESRIQHTPLTVVYNGGGILQTIMNLASLKTELSIGRGNFNTPSYLLPVNFQGLELATDLNQLRLLASNVTIGRTGFSLLSQINGLEPFLTSYSATPLYASADIDFTNVDINQLSWGYYGALLKQGKDSVFSIPPLKPYTAADSLCVVIPRNIEADIRLKSKSAEYFQYKFSPLSTDIIVKDGVATLSKLTIGTPYCMAEVDWTYSTSHLDDIFMDLKAQVKNFSFNKFYTVFPDLLAKAPELHNLTGAINANINCNFEMYPNMFMNAESLKGNFDIKGSELEFAREGKIEKITHLMLIDGDQPIHIENINITGAYHDNLLQLNPFKINFDSYQLELAGVNNTQGDMYFHFALEKSPFHLPFGVSVFGNLKHPEIRLGGTRIDDYRTEAVSNHLSSKIDVNIMAWLHHGWLMFIQEAAKFEQNHQED